MRHYTGCCISSLVIKRSINSLTKKIMESRFLRGFFSFLRRQVIQSLPFEVFALNLEMIPNSYFPPKSTDLYFIEIPQFPLYFPVEIISIRFGFCKDYGPCNL